jgi:hypothetical protein
MTDHHSEGLRGFCDIASANLYLVLFAVVEEEVTGSMV